MCALPGVRFPTGVMRGRFHPGDGQLYLCGLFAWAGNATQPGGFYRVRYTGAPVHLPVKLQAIPDGMRLVFSGELDPDSVRSVEHWAVKTCSLRRTASYGSDHYDERKLAVAGVSLGEDRRTVELKLPGLEPTWCMEIRYDLQSASGGAITGVLHNTVHKIPARRSQ
jgi:hypothetical protein